MLTDGISSLVIDQLCDQAVGQKIAVACYYCDFQSQKMQTSGNVLGALIKQIVRGSGTVPTGINAAFQKAKGQVGGRGLRVPEALELLRSALAPLDRAFICIDALDELPEKYLSKLLHSLRVISQSCPEIRFFFTGRPHITVRIEEYFHGSAQFLQIRPMREDIIRYVGMMLDGDPDPAAMNADLRAEIVNRVLETISDVYVTLIFSSRFEYSLRVVPRFLLVSLNIAAILSETTVYQRRERLKRMTNGRDLGDAYHATLERIKAQSWGKSRLGMAALMWISRSVRPMRAEELCHALGVQIGSTNPNPDNIPSIRTLLASCLGLVIVDREEPTVRLVHFTLQEYLNSRSEMFQSPYAVMAEVCLTYLNFDCIKSLPPTLDAAPQENPFLQYASSYWGHYARNETTDGVKSLALQLLDGFDSHISAKLLLRSNVLELMIGLVRLAKGFTGLHCVAYLGIDGIAKALLDMKDWDVDQADFVGHTPLIWASKNGHEGIIMLLEGAGANLNAKDTRNGQTALSWAAQYGQEGATKLLLAQDKVNPELRDNYGRTPLSHAAEYGSEGIVKLLLEREGVNPESRDDYGRTPFSWAARPGQSGQGIVKLLLRRSGVNPESQDNSGRSSSYEAEYESEGTAGPEKFRENARLLSERICERRILKLAFSLYCLCAHLFFSFVHFPLFDALMTHMGCAFLSFLEIRFPRLNPFVLFMGGNILYISIIYYHPDSLVLLTRNSDWMCLMAPLSWIWQYGLYVFFQCCDECYYQSSELPPQTNEKTPTR